MPLRRLEDIRPGMVLQGEVRTPDGRLLLPSGAELAQAHLDLLHRFEVESVDVARELGESDLEAASAHVHRFFMYVDHDDPVMNLLFSAAVVRTATRMAQGWKPAELDPRIAAANGHLDDLFMRDEGTVQDMVDSEQAIASFPDVYFRLREVLEKGGANAAEVAAVVNADAGLSSRLLRLVNSPFYGFSAKVDTVERAVALVGERELSTLALGISAISYFKDIPPQLVDMKVFWKHSLACAVLCAIIAARAGNLATEQVFTAGLLHDMGKLILFKKLPHASVQTLLHARENYVPLVEAEYLVLGFDHGEVAEALMRTWNFPEGLRAMVALHHTPDQAGERHRAAAVVQLADCVVNALEISEGGNFVVPFLQPGTLELLGLSVEDLEAAITEFDGQFAETAGAFL